MNTDLIAHGGLMRCDVQTIRDRFTPGVEGEIQQCQYTDSPDHRMVFRDGAWRWLRDEAEKPDPAGAL
jgi:hypothetical protein